jgi:hypothetical protein
LDDLAERLHPRQVWREVKNPDPINLPSWLRLGGGQRKNETDSETDRELE